MLLDFRELSTLPISTIAFKRMSTMKFVQKALEKQLTGQEEPNNTPGLERDLRTSMAKGQSLSTER